jgi:hypothetical protein
VAASLPERTDTAAQLNMLRAGQPAEDFTRAWETGTKLSTVEAIDQSMRLRHPADS